MRPLVASGGAISVTLNWVPSWREISSPVPCRPDFTMSSEGGLGRYASLSLPGRLGRSDVNGPPCCRAAVGSADLFFEQFPVAIVIRGRDMIFRCGAILRKRFDLVLADEKLRCRRHGRIWCHGSSITRLGPAAGLPATSVEWRPPFFPDPPSRLCSPPVSPWLPPQVGRMGRGTSIGSACEIFRPKPLRDDVDIRNVHVGHLQRARMYLRRLRRAKLQYWSTRCLPPLN